MKSRIIFFIAALAVFSSSANAQTFNTLQFIIPTCTTNYAKSIVRVAPSNTEVVSCHSHGTYDDFILIDNNSVTRRFKVPDDIHVRDFQIVDNNVFFCGQKQDEAIVGHFDIQIFYLPNLYQFKYYTTIYSGDIVKNYFKKMVAYHNQDNTKIQIEVIGDKEHTQYVSNNNIIGEYIYDPATDQIISSYYIASTIFYLIYHQDGIFQDIAVTEDYLVVSGWDYSDQKLLITRFPKYSVLSGGTTYEFDESADPYTSSRIYLEALSSNDIATAATYINTNTLQVGTRLRTFDVSTMSNTVSQLLPMLDKTEPDDMLFMEEDQSLLLLQQSFYPTINDFQYVIYYLDPYNNSYTTDAYYNFNSSYYSLDRFNDPIYIAAGLTPNYNHGYLMRFKPSPHVSCIKFGNVRIIPLNRISYINITPFTLSHSSITPYSVNVGPEIWGLEIECMD